MVRKRIFVEVIKILIGSSEPATYLSMAALSFVFAYSNFEPLSNALCKKLALAVAAVNLISFSQTKGLRTTFPLELMASVSVGAVCAIAALLLPWPKLAVSEARAFAVTSSKCTSAAFSALLESFVARTDERSSYMRVQVAALPSFQARRLSCCPAALGAAGKGCKGSSCVDAGKCRDV
eukprot:jgi/Mesen1/5747/ME000292S04830